MRANVELTPERCAVECLRPEHVRPLLGKVIGDREADGVAATFGLLADPTRARILHALSLAKELCVCDLALLLGLSQSAVSHQLRLLRGHQVVERRRDGRIVYYRLGDRHVRRVFGDSLRHSREGAPARAARAG